jgi:hypothetical protein
MHPYKQSGRWKDVLYIIFYVISVHFVGSYYIDISQCTVQKTQRNDYIYPVHHSVMMEVDVISETM